MTLEKLLLLEYADLTACKKIPWKYIQAEPSHFEVIWHLFKKKEKKKNFYSHSARYFPLSHGNSSHTCTKENRPNYVIGAIGGTSLFSQCLFSSYQSLLVPQLGVTEKP